MFVVGVYSFDSDCNTDVLICLFDSTDGAQKYINEKILKTKRDVVINNFGWEKAREYREAFPFTDVDPMTSKPKFDHNRAKDNEYNRQHEAAIVIWREEVKNPYDRKKREYEQGVQDNVNSYKKEFEENLLDSHPDVQNVEIYEKYSTRILEVYK